MLKDNNIGFLEYIKTNNDDFKALVEKYNN